MHPRTDSQFNYLRKYVVYLMVKMQSGVSRHSQTSDVGSR
jgi:hypothetical protein